jgi:hypothetical protein
LFLYEEVVHRSGAIGRRVLWKVGGIKDAETRKTVAAGIRKFLAARAGKRFQGTITLLKKVEGSDDAGVKKLLNKEMTPQVRDPIWRIFSRFFGQDE